MLVARLLIGSVLLLLAEGSDLFRRFERSVCDTTKLMSCYEDYFGHFGISARPFPSYDHFVGRMEMYMSNEPTLARPTLCSWHRTLARCLAPTLERACISRQSLRTAVAGISDSDAFNYALLFETNQYECGDGFRTVTDYIDCLEEVRTCDRSEVEASVQGCTNTRTSEVRGLSGDERKCKVERITNECLIRFGVSRCGKAVEKYYCKIQEFVSRKRIFEDPSICTEAFRCYL
ncbi:hypothetical protein QR680_005665 [Steinernema hermaphroditum]|uniref:DUF19 domain-containing protein n=1 Tax=Steinernema hermaphroditum TaxID=289476 RepID=A0AA39HSX6_9BILA|nr:hypothetical protein QR680_005665 [Steinernema hermaphroditum]